MSYTSRVIGSRDVIQEDRIIAVNTGDPAPTPADGYSILKIATYETLDLYLEYRHITGDFNPA